LQIGDLQLLDEVISLFKEHQNFFYAAISMIARIIEKILWVQTLPSAPSKNHQTRSFFARFKRRTVEKRLQVQRSF
jgi:hypothetical protein